MEISVVRPGELRSDDIHSWHSMQQSSIDLTNPFLSPEFTIAAGRFRPRARVAVLTDGPSAVGFFPFEQRRFGTGIPIASGLTDCQGLIHAPGAEWDAKELLRACQISTWSFDHLVAGQMPFDGYRAATIPSPVINLDDGYDSYYKKLTARSSQLCRNVARKERKLSREVGELRLVLESQDISVLHTLMSWKSEQYDRTAQVNRFAQAWVTGLVEALFETRNHHFSGLLSVLYAGDLPVAAHFGLRSGPVLAHWFPAYDTSFRTYSPGLILHLRMAESAASTGINLIDLGTGFQRYKEELKTGDLFVGKGTVARRSVLATAQRAQSDARQWALRTVKSHPSLYQAAGTLRGHYRRARGTRRDFPAS